MAVQTSVEVHKQSLGERLTSCFTDFFKSCYNFDKTNKRDPGDRKSAKLELIEVPTDTTSKGPDQGEPPRFDEIDKYQSVNYTSQTPEAYPGSHDPQQYQPSDMHPRKTLPSADSFDFSEEDSDYWKQASEVMKQAPAKSALQRQGSTRRHSKLVRFGSVVRKFDKLEELLQQPPDEEVYYDEEGSEFDDDYLEEGEEYYDQDGYQTQDMYAEYGRPDEQSYQTSTPELYGGHARQEDYYEEDPYGQFPASQQRSEYTQQGYSQQYTQDTYPSNSQHSTEQAHNNQHQEYYTEHAQNPPDPPTTRRPSLNYRGSFKSKAKPHIGGVVPSATYHKPLPQDEYKVDIRARVKALERGRDSQEELDIPKKPTMFTQGHLPFELSLPNYEAIKSTHAARIGQPLYTHPGGYKFRIDLWASGKGVGVNTHISVTVHSLEGENNDKLTFPARFDIALELLNQYSDYDHHQRKIECYYQEGGYNTEIGRDLKFIAKEDIYWNAERRTQYLLNDELRFRVTRITLM